MDSGVISLAIAVFFAFHDPEKMAKFCGVGVGALTAYAFITRTANETQKCRITSVTLLWISRNPELWRCRELPTNSEAANQEVPPS